MNGISGNYSIAQFNLSYTSTSIEFSNLENNNTGELTENMLNNNMQKFDMVEISAKFKMAEFSYSNEIQEGDFSALEARIGIDSSTWGVEAVSDNLFEFVEIMFESYKLNHEDEDSQSVLDAFYEMATSSYEQGFGEAKNFLGTMNDDITTLMESTINRTMEKIDAWYENGGVRPESEGNIDFEEINTIDLASEMASEAERMRNFVLDELKKQGITLGEASTSTPFFEIEA